MSHFTTLVVLPKDTELEQVQDRLAEVMAPWDENKQVEPYRNYEDAATPAAHWQYPYVYADALPAADAPPVGWPQYIEDLARHNGEDSEQFEYDPEQDRVFTMSTYNPLSKWDWWQVGGRWRNALVAKPTVDRSALLIDASAHWSEQYGNDSPTARGPAGGLRCNGGRLCDIDLEAMREEKGTTAGEAFDRYLAAITPELAPTTAPWAHFYERTLSGAYDEEVARLNADDMVHTELVGTRGQTEVHARDLARRDYKAQPGIERLNEDERFRAWWGCPVDEYGTSREAYVARQQANFMPCYSMVTLEGEWLASGDMGWWGASSATNESTDTFKADALAYLRGLDQESIVVLLDLHI